ncbi:MAG TPA: cation transporter [Acidimicrobiales bacterium]|nr:cation transporter [Acidimicrobiales bacterium]
MATTTYTVTGMTCGHCESAVKGELTKLDGVTEVNVDLDSGAVEVSSEADLDDIAVRAAIEEAGFELAG